MHLNNFNEDSRVTETLNLNNLQSALSEIDNRRKVDLSNDDFSKKVITYLKSEVDYSKSATANEFDLGIIVDLTQPQDSLLLERIDLLYHRLVGRGSADANVNNGRLASVIFPTHANGLYMRYIFRSTDEGFVQSVSLVKKTS